LGLHDPIWLWDFDLFITELEKQTLDLLTLKAKKKQNLRHFACMKIIKL